MPRIIETGTFKKSVILAFPPCAMLRNVVNNTITKMSSQDAPARIICGIDFFVPTLVSIRCTILGTTTAGETAPKTAPITAASILDIPRIAGAKKTYPAISQVAGTNDSKMAGLPTFFKSSMSKDKPALSKIIINAIFRKSAEIESIEESNRLRTNGPNTMPVMSMPIIRGSFSRGRKKADAFYDKKS